MDSTTQDDASRRAFWTKQMEAGYAVMQRVLPFPVDDCGEGLADLRAAAAAADVEMRFSASPIADDVDRVFFIREGLADDLIAVAQDMNRRGWVLKLEDAFRSHDMQTRLGRKPEIFDAIVQKCAWESGETTPPPDLVFRRAQVLVANVPKTGTHMSASAIDISVFHRGSDQEVWRGGPYLEMSECTPMRSPFISGEELKNRLEITAMMEVRGFVHYPYEFWHFNKDDALGHVVANRTRTARYGPIDWDPQSNSVTPFADPLALLNPLDTMQTNIDAALERLSS